MEKIYADIHVSLRPVPLSLLFCYYIGYSHKQDRECGIEQSRGPTGELACHNQMQNTFISHSERRRQYQTLIFSSAWSAHAKRHGSLAVATCKSCCGCQDRPCIGRRPGNQAAAHSCHAHQYAFAQGRVLCKQTKEPNAESFYKT